MSDHDTIPGGAADEQAPGGQPQTADHNGGVSGRLAIQVAEALEKAAQAAEGEGKLRLLAQAEQMRNRMTWKLEKDWPGLFKLYRMKDGQFTVILDERLAEIEQRVRQGLDPSRMRVVELTKALEAILFSSCQPDFTPPTNEQIPSLDNPLTTMQDVHRAAQRMLVQTSAAAVVFAALQNTFGAHLKEVYRVLPDQRSEAVEALKKDVCKALDAFFSQSPKGIAHKNKAKLKTSSGDHKLYALLTIEKARQWVEIHHELPSKRQLHEELKQEHPMDFPKDRTWPKILKEAGLSDLPRDAHW